MLDSPEIFFINFHIGLTIILVHEHLWKRTFERKTIRKSTNPDKVTCFRFSRRPLKEYEILVEVDLNKFEIVEAAAQLSCVC